MTTTNRTLTAIAGTLIAGSLLLAGMRGYHRQDEPCRCHDRRRARLRGCRDRGAGSQRELDNGQRR